MKIPTASDEQRQHFAEQGFVVARGAADAAQLKAAVDAVEGILDRAVAGEFGDQFRWTDEGNRVPAFVNDLLSPSKYAPAFGDLLDQVMLPIAESLLGRPVRCSWLLMLTGGADQPYSVPLHRDNGELGGASESEQLELYRMNGCYFQAPILSHDNFLQVIPGSHLRMASDREVAVARSNNPSQDLPGLQTIELDPGDIVFRETNLIHQGWNPAGLPRWTFVAALWAADLPIQPIELKNYETIASPGFVESMPGRCKDAAKRFLEAYEQREL